MVDLPRPYEQCATRLENRGDRPPDAVYTDRLVAALQDTGVEACWHSAVDSVGRPLYPSKIILRGHPDASFESFRYLINGLHGIGRPVLSWYPLNMNRALLEEHPGWRMQFYDLPGVAPQPDRSRSYCCFNSPYGQLLPELAVEIVRDVGFDGLWFDGSTMSNHETAPAFAPGCRCAFCRERFAKDTALDLPEEIDFRSETFRRWVNWRYGVLMDVWRRITDAVHAVRPEATVCFNNYRRRHCRVFAWTTAIPLRPLNMDILMSGELDNFPHQADFQMKMHRAYGCGRGVETWWPLCDHLNAWVPDVEPLPAVQAALGAISAGGVACTGVGVDPHHVGNALRAMQQAASRALPFLGGTPVRYAAIVCSGATQDFAHHEDPRQAYDEWHGANELCRHAHLPSAILFEDHLAAETLAEYPVVILGNAVCLDEQHAKAIRAYVEQGGSVVACHRVGELDALGRLHPRPVLDDLLGVESRRIGTADPTLKVCEATLRDAVGTWASFKHHAVLAEPAADAELLAGLVERIPEGGGKRWDDPGASGAAGGLWIRSAGKGAAAYCGINLFSSYLVAPTPHVMHLLSALITRMAPPPVTLEGPMCVTINARCQADGRWAVHLHNCPGSTYRYPAPPRSNYLHTPGEVLPVYGLTLRLSGVRAVAAESGITGQPFEITEDGQAIAVPELELHDVALITLDDPCTQRRE